MTEATNRTRANRQLHQLCLTYFDGLPLAQIDEILRLNDFTSMEAAIYCGRDGHTNEQVGPKTWLSLSWHKMEVTGRYEVVAYVS